jgi:hypothetical protein
MEINTVQRLKMCGFRFYGIARHPQIMLQVALFGLGEGRMLMVETDGCLSIIDSAFNYITDSQAGQELMALKKLL